MMLYHNCCSKLNQSFHKLKDKKYIVNTNTRNKGASEMRGYEIINSFQNENSTFSVLEDKKGEEFLCVNGKLSDKFGKPIGEHSTGQIFPRNVKTVYHLKEIFSWLKPEVTKGKPSFGFGDRIGIATPGHIRAIDEFDIFPVFAQQSIREMTRTNRKPEDVLADAIWGVFREGYKNGFGADADHLKTKEDVENTVNAGFKMFTCDPGNYVNNVEDMNEDRVYKSFKDITESDQLLLKYEDETYKFENLEFKFNKNDVIQAAVKYYDAIKHAERMFNWIEKKMNEEFEYEISVDETEYPTSPKEHIFIARELIDRNIDFDNLALRFVGDFEKGIDYKGDLSEFRSKLKTHSEILRKFGSYKISLHSGSDKFSIYPEFRDIIPGRFHVKTAGTNYLEGLRVIADSKPDLFEDIFVFSLENFDKARETYHISLDIDDVAPLSEFIQKDYSEALDVDSVRQALHVNYGAVLTAKDKSGEYKFYDDIIEVLLENKYLHYQYLKSHLKKHLKKLVN